MKEFRKGITYLVVLENNFYSGSDSVDGALMCGRRYLSMSGSDVIKNCIGVTIPEGSHCNLEGEGPLG
jgi:uncharacterized protein YbbC (DUF1343 family)